MKLIDKLKEVLLKKKSKFRIRGEISENKSAEIRMTNIVGQPITLGDSPSEVKMSIQPLCGFPSEFGRIDNSHGYTHHHSGAVQLPYPLQMNTISGSLLILFGQEYWSLEKTQSE